MSISFIFTDTFAYLFMFCVTKMRFETYYGSQYVLSQRLCRNGN